MAANLIVPDSWPVMEWLKAREPAATNFDELIALAWTGEVQLLISNINSCEIYYNCWKEWGQVRAVEIRLGFDQLPVRIVHPTPENVLAAASIKARYSFPYADAFAVVLALEYGGSVLTGDPDYLLFAQNSFVSIEWWGK